jgi:hypothetical protein
MRNTLMPSHRHVILCADTRIRSQYFFDVTADTNDTTNIFQTWKDSTERHIRVQVLDAISHYFDSGPGGTTDQTSLYADWWKQQREKSGRFEDEEQKWLDEGDHTPEERYKFYRKRPAAVTQAADRTPSHDGVSAASVQAAFIMGLQDNPGFASSGDGLRFQCKLAEEPGVCHSDSCYFLIHVMNVCYGVMRHTCHPFHFTPYR